MPSVLLATFSLCPDGEPGGDLLGPLAERGVDARWACWDDPEVDWAGADLVAVRSTWDYHRRLPEFLAWAREVERHTPLLNGAAVFAHNADKSYLVDLAELVPTVPSHPVDERTLVAGLEAGLAAYGAVVVKARTGASGVGVVVAEERQDQRLAGLTAGPWLVQPLVASVRTRGESSLFVLDGRVVSQVDKRPAAADAREIRVHEEYGGNAVAVPVDPEAERAALAAMDAAARLVGRPLDYGRVDLMELDGRLVVGEVELIEPGLYLDVAPGNAAPFADLVLARTATPTTA
jgi:glutathione synthase/RimK-type ligase-like ATP-grasp enzyme